MPKVRALRNRSSLLLLSYKTLSIHYMRTASIILTHNKVIYHLFISSFYIFFLYYLFISILN
jgi:hypothetical protein